MASNKTWSNNINVCVCWVSGKNTCIKPWQMDVSPYQICKCKGAWKFIIFIIIFIFALLVWGVILSWWVACVCNCPNTLLFVCFILGFFCFFSFVCFWIQNSLYYPIDCATCWRVMVWMIITSLLSRPCHVMTCALAAQTSL